MNILLHGPLHLSFWIYLMELLDEHKFFIDGDSNFEEGSIPYNHIRFRKYTGIEKIDVQIICVHLEREIGTVNALKEIEQNFPFPIVWVEYGRDKLHEFKFRMPSPLMTTSISNHRLDYPANLMRHVYAVPSKKLWSKAWIGDEKKIFIPMRKLLFSNLDIDQAHTIKLLEEKEIKLEFTDTLKRDTPFTEWQDKFIHSRVLLEITSKPSSTTLSEGMVTGIPIVTFDKNDYRYQIRHGIDGFRSNYPLDLVKYCEKFLEDYDYAKKMGKRAKERADEIFNPQITRQVWNTAFYDAIRCKKDFKPLEKISKEISKERQIVRIRNRETKEEIHEILEKKENPKSDLKTLQQNIQKERIMQENYITSPMPCKNCGASLVKREGELAICFKCGHVFGGWMEYWEKYHREEI